PGPCCTPRWRWPSVPVGAGKAPMSLSWSPTRDGSIFPRVPTAARWTRPRRNSTGNSGPEPRSPPVAFPVGGARSDQRTVEGVTSPKSSFTGSQESDSKRVLPRQPAAAAILAGAFTVLLCRVEIVDGILPADLDEAGIGPRRLGGLEGIVWSPLLHSGWAHLVGNTIPILVFAFLVTATGLARWFAVTGIVWGLGGFGVWLTAPSDTVTIGASGLAFGWLAFLLVRG